MSCQFYKLEKVGNKIKATDLCGGGKPIFFSSIEDFQESDLTFELISSPSFQNYDELLEWFCESEDPPIEVTDYELTCVIENDGIYILDTTSFPPVLKDINGIVVTGLTPSVCRNITLDTEKEFFCVDGVDYTRNDCIKKDKDGVLVSIDSFWQNVTGAIVPEPTGVKIKGACVIDECEPKTESFIGNNATLLEFDIINAIIPKCCEVTITTSAGVITLPAQPSKYSFSQEFKCMITDFEIESDCVRKITTILTKSK